MNGIVNLSSYNLTNAGISFLSKGWAFAPLQGHQTGNIIHDLDAFKRTRLQLFFYGSSQDPLRNNTQSGVPFENKSFKLKSSFNSVGPFQLESIFCSIEQDLHRQKYREPRKKNLTEEEYKAVRIFEKTIKT